MRKENYNNILAIPIITLEDSNTLVNNQYIILLIFKFIIFAFMIILII